MSKKYEYVWLDGYKPEPSLRSKVKIDNSAVTWSFDGSSTRQAEGESSDCVLNPVNEYFMLDRIRPDATRARGNTDMSATYVMCEVLNADDSPHSTNTRNKIKSISIKHDDGTVKKIETNYVLGFFGLIMKLGPIVNWGLNLDKKHIPVNTENYETNQKGIFAIGDICTYPGKVKLILSGFHEGALAARGCFKYARPDEKLKFEFSTTSKSVHERLGVKK